MFETAILQFNQFKSKICIVFELRVFQTVGVMGEVGDFCKSCFVLWAVGCFWTKMVV